MMATAGTDWRAHFSTGEGIYLLSHSVGRMPLTSRDALERGFLGPWERAESEPWPQWMAALEAFPEALAALLGARPGDICPQVNVSSALVKLLGASRPAPGRNVVLFSERDFPSLGFVIERARQLGYEGRMVPASADVQDLAVWDAALTADVYSVLITHVYSNTGQQAPVADIAALARQRGVFSIVDVAQSLGVIPINVGAWRADAVLGSCVKWSCGGPGAGFLWLDPARLPGLEPLDVGWFSHRSPFEFDIHHFEYAGDAGRFMGGTPSVLPFVLAANSLALIGRIGVETIRAHNLALTERLLSALEPGELQSPAEPERRGGTVVVRAARPGDFSARLAAAGVACDERSAGVRLSPHIYNTTGDIDTVIDCLRG